MAFKLNVLPFAACQDIEVACSLQDILLNIDWLAGGSLEFLC